MNNSPECATCLHYRSEHVSGIGCRRREYGEFMWGLVSYDRCSCPEYTETA